jgi:flagellin
MSITIQSPAASVTSIALRKTQNVVNESMTRLATGKQLNGAKDNVVGLNAQTSLMAEIRGLTQASKNAGIGIAINDAADAALAETTFILQRMRELAVQGASTAITATTRSALGIEVSALYGVISNLAADTKYNGQALLDGTFASEVVHIGPNATNGSVTYSLSSIAPASLGAYVSEGYTRVPVTAASSEPVNNTTISEDIMVDSTSIDAVANETAKDVAAKN